VKTWFERLILLKKAGFSSSGVAKFKIGHERLGGFRGILRKAKKYPFFTKEGIRNLPLSGGRDERANWPR